MENPVGLAVSTGCFKVIAALSPIYFYLLVLTPVLSCTFVRGSESIPRREQQGGVSCHSVLHQTSSG